MLLRASESFLRKHKDSSEKAMQVTRGSILILVFPAYEGKFTKSTVESNRGALDVAFP